MIALGLCRLRPSHQAIERRKALSRCLRVSGETPCTWLWPDTGPGTGKGRCALSGVCGGAKVISTFTKRLKESRDQSGLSQKQLGIKAGIDEFSASARMNQYETGKHHPDLKTVTRLCKVLKVPVAFMYCDDDDLAQVIASYPTLSQHWPALRASVSQSVINSYLTILHFY